MKDTYKCDIINNHFIHMGSDEYYGVRVKGDKEKSFNLDEKALMMLYAYYSGGISDEEINHMYYQR